LPRCARTSGAGSAITDAALQLSPVEIPGIYFYRAAAQFNLKQFLDAEATVRVAIDLDTDRGFPQSHYLLGRILEMKHDFGGAIEQMKKCLALAPKAPDAPEIRKRIADIETRL
jgi:tetratricopeptide (TPR) repeat protein